LSDVLKKTLQDMTLKQLMERKNKQDMGGHGWVEYII
jgi:hypothetical protein